MERLSARTENYLRDILLIFFAQKRIILAIAVAVLAGALGVAVASPERFAADGSILLRSNEYQRSPDAVRDAAPKLFRVTESDLRSEREIILSPVVVDGAIQLLREGGADFAEGLTAGQVRGNLSVSVVPSSKVLQVQLTWGRPEPAVEILDSVLASYIRRRSEILNPADAGRFFSSQVERYRAQLNEAKERLVELTSEMRTADPEKEIQANIEFKESLRRSLSDLRVQEVELSEELELIDSMLGDAQIRLYAFLDNDAMSDLAGQLVDLSIERGKIARNYNDETRMVSAIDKQILEASAQLRREASDYRQVLAADLQSVKGKIDVLEAEVAALANRNADLQIHSIETESVQREVDLLQESFGTFFKRQEEAKGPSAGDGALSLFYVSILSPAHTSGRAVWPNRPLLIVGGLLGGLLLGFTVGFLREFVDHSFKIPRDVEQFTGLRVLFSIPRG